MRLTLTIGLLVSLVAVPALAEAAPRRYSRYEERRDDRYRYRYEDSYRHGLFARVALGAAGVAADDNLNDSTLTGGAGLFSLDLGGSLAPNLALHGRFSVNSMFEPRVSSDGEDFGDLDDTSLTFTLLGAGLTYYLPSNLYLTGVAGFSRASFELYGEEYDSLNGGGFMGEIGYQFPMGGDWGLDVAGRLELHNVRGEGEQLSTAALGVLLSLTYF
jgi:hypothetical protein